jgi:hypothetical protein
MRPAPAHTAGKAKARGTSLPSFVRAGGMTARAFSAACKAVVTGVPFWRALKAPPSWGPTSKLEPRGESPIVFAPLFAGLKAHASTGEEGAARKPLRRRGRVEGPGATFKPWDPAHWGFQPRPTKTRGCRTDSKAPPPWDFRHSSAQTRTYKCGFPRGANWTIFCAVRGAWGMHLAGAYKGLKSRKRAILEDLAL